MIPGRCDYDKRMCDAIVGRIDFMFGKVDGLLELSVKDEKRATESKMMLESPTELNTGAPTMIGSTLTRTDARIIEND